MIEDDYNGFLMGVNDNFLADKIYHVYMNKDSLDEMKESVLKVLTVKFDLNR